MEVSGKLRTLARGSNRVGARDIYRPAAAPTQAMEHEFFGALRLANGTFKTTYAQRLDDLNVQILRHLPGRETIRAKDVAASTGVSTMEWYDSLAAAGIDCKMTASDLHWRARLLACPGLTVLTDVAGNVLQVDVAGRVLNGEIAPKPLLRLFRALPSREVTLASPRLTSYPIEIVEEDLFRSAPGRWDVIRAANILNRSYFPEQQLRAGVASLVGTLAPRGILAVCRTKSDGSNHGSVFRLADDRLELLDDLGDGSEVKDLALELHLDLV